MTMIGSLLTFEAATSCAVLAAISCEHTINSSNFPLPCTTRSAASLEGHNTEFNINSRRKQHHVLLMWRTTSVLNYFPRLKPDWQFCLFLHSFPNRRSTNSCFETFTEASQLLATHSPSANFMNLSTFISLRDSGEDWYLHHDRGAPSHCFGGRDQALSPAGVLGIEFLHGGCPLVDTRGHAQILR